MTHVGKFRYVRIDLSTDLSSHMIIATLAHELQHVSEVIDNPLVVDEGSLSALYRRIGRPSQAIATEGWETVAALETGHQVRRELAVASGAGDANMTRDDSL